MWRAPTKATWVCAKLAKTPHKAPWNDDKDGLLWFNKACGSTRVATTTVDIAKKKGKDKRWRAYLGGGGGQRPELAHTGPRHPCEGLGLGCLHPRRSLAAVGVQRPRQASSGWAKTWSSRAMRPLRSRMSRWWATWTRRMRPGRGRAAPWTTTRRSSESEVTLSRRRSTPVSRTGPTGCPRGTTLER